MASMRDIKRRRSSIESTQQITKAMKLVSTVKLQRAKQRAEQSKYYFNSIYETVSSILAKAEGIDHPYLRAGSGGKKVVIMITSNKGLAGGYNSNVIKLITRNPEFSPENTKVYVIGKKGKDAFKRAGYEIMADFSEAIEAPNYRDGAQITDELLSGFAKGEISEIYLAYTFFKNTVSHIPTLLKLLPVDNLEKYDKDEDEEQSAKAKAEKKTAEAPMNFEPEDEEALNLIIPKYMASLIYGALIEAQAAENGARMQAMDNATNNATEMIEHLTLLYNRARQGSITQELTEIIAGANAIS
ncbi:MAG: ATP synthase F1 subunit gamma [Lachnospiraceae bacterium]|nr:ATP synthase F1 subunit gamma [Lachnospiraceae bacterium]MBR4543280.1 ATP synthase F1 subunit gamma [Lachnospiraceae bacterium]